MNRDTEKDVERADGGGDGAERRHDGGGVSVEQAEADFAELQREMTTLSRMSRRKSKNKAGDEGLDADKLHSSSASDGGESFDLESILRNGLNYVGQKHIGVYWNNVTVKGTGGDQVNYIKSFMHTFPEFLQISRLLGALRPCPETTILRGASGICKPGEMVLVLGKPGSGCTTWLKTIANQHSSFGSVTGDILYGPYAPAEFEKRFRGEAVFNDEMDAHIPSLTVEQTLGFVLDVRLPAHLPEVFPSRRCFKSHVITTLLRMFNIEHTRHTVVGDHLIRGISGGEKRRLSIAEMMITRASVLAWDNSTRGLDSATALDFVKSARVLTNLYRTTTFITLYQASENMYREFDKVLVLDAGHQVYFGPARLARDYFAGLGFQPDPRQTTPDFLTACTDQFERRYADGRGPGNAPHDTTTLERAFLESDIKSALDGEMAAYKESLHMEDPKYCNFRTAVKESKRASTSVYSVGFHLQLWALVKRQFRRRWQDWLAITILYSRVVILGLVFGSLYFNLDSSSSAAFARSSVCFMLILFNAYSSYSDLSATMSGRPILSKHRAFALHRPSALWIANSIVDQMFAAVSTLTIAIIVYFMTGFVRTAGGFFTFYALMLAANMSFSLMFKMLGAVSKDSQRANIWSNILVTLLLLAAGYHIQYVNTPWWIRWLTWINPLALAFRGTMANELRSLLLTCSDESLIPSGPGYDDINHQVCTLAGSRSGSDQVDGAAYLKATFDIDADEIWRNFGIILAVVAFLLLLNVFLGEVLSFESSSRSSRVFQRPNAERKALNEALEVRRRSKVPGSHDIIDDEKIITSESILTWEKLCYDVPTSKGKKRLLSDVYGYVRPGELTALMGASGAGKTTLLDVLAQRKNIGVISGEILVDGARLPKNFQRGTSYAEQQDVHEATQTVREALRFSADLRQSRETPRKEKYDYVEDIISLLEMEDIADCMIGTLELGLTIEQRKRVTIAVELCAKPELLLFLDEPTSGLDSQGAFNIIRYLRKLAAKGQAILCTIHQPNAALFASFDRLLLLERPGRTVYFGEIGTDGETLRAYFSRNGAHAGPSENIAEFMLEAIGAGTKPRVGSRPWCDVWDESPEAAREREEIRELKRQRRAQVASGAHTVGEAHAEREYATTFFTQVRLVTGRMNASFYRDQSYVFTKIINHVIIAVLNAGSFVQLGDSRADLQNTVLLSFQINVLVFLLLASCQTMYHEKRAVFFREDASKMYSPFVFAVAMLIAEIPWALISAALFFVPIYYIPYQHDTMRALYVFIMVLALELFSITLAFAMSAVTPTAFITEQINPFMLISMSQFCGVTITPPEMPAFWRSWLYRIDPMTYTVEGIVTVMLHGKHVECKPSEFNSFAPPPDAGDCGRYMADFFAAGGSGYLSDPNSTTTCDYCFYRVGDEYFEPMWLFWLNRWRDVGIACAFLVGNVAILLVAARVLNFNKR